MQYKYFLIYLPNIKEDSDDLVVILISVLKYLRPFTLGPITSLSILFFFHIKYHHNFNS